MYTVFVLGNIASGKSTACRYLASLGGYYIDLDELAKSLYVPGSELVLSIAREFGLDVLDAQGSIRRDVLARRAFVSPEATARLNALVHPCVIEQLSIRLLGPCCCTVPSLKNPFAVVEVSAPRGFEDAFGLADEVIAITAPVEVRRARAIERGMTASDFDARAERQPSEDELRSMASLSIDNSRADDALFDALRAWALSRGFIDTQAGKGVPRD